MHCKQIRIKSGQTRWECYGDGPHDPATGKRKLIKRRGKTKNEAKKRVEQAIRSLAEDKIDQGLGKKVTFEMAAVHWLEVYTLTGVKRSTIRIREKETKILNTYIAKTPISHITHAQYQQLLNEISPKYARTTVQGVNTTAGMIFRQAIKDKLIKDNPQESVVIPKKRRTVEDIEKDQIQEKYLEREELEEFLTAIRNHGLDLDAEWFYLLAFSGMRSGELLALKWTDVNFKNNEIRITKTLYNEDNNMKKYELTPPKTEGSIRTISIEHEIMQLLKSHHRRQSKVKMKYRHEIEDYHDANFIFCRPNGYPFIQKNIIMRMNRLLSYTKITKKATPHIFRHSHISMMTEAGIDIATIMEKVGHEDMKTTMKIYTHVTNKMKKDASVKVRSLYENALSNIVL
ncbi:site-specific integrase [Salipaludibacillus agaradhaerens]|jgi:integrase|uniref:tyrosine-type recombinase/integrase n=1 Tax=Salipaludibacillus TaxID=1884449 RepID=UPI0020D0C2F6|nr:MULTISPECIES: tyrosine-type recombinase/integrase [Salipaludibacillus]MCR6116616.1 site-specific integrase [Salipaludibacillus agaradhaerens]UTR13446.1 site-specific integrase [Salipaludibacillus sp. LMS25]